MENKLVSSTPPWPLQTLLLPGSCYVSVPVLIFFSGEQWVESVNHPPKKNPFLLNVIFCHFFSSWHITAAIETVTKTYDVYNLLYYCKNRAIRVCLWWWVIVWVSLRWKCKISNDPKFYSFLASLLHTEKFISLMCMSCIKYWIYIMYIQY